MRIGILGGTFDPIHYGHILPALEVKQALGLDRIYLMPNHIPPHKPQPIVSTLQRLTMVEQVCNQLDGFALCDIEATRSSPSYTAVTLKQLKTLHPQDELFFMMGMDSFMQLSTWYEWQTLFDLTHLVVCQRPGWQLLHNHPMQQILQQRSTTVAAFNTWEKRDISPPNTLPLSGCIVPVNVTARDISSTHIRAQFAQGQIPEEALMPVTLEYIKQQQLY